MVVLIVAFVAIAAAMARREDVEAGREFWRGHGWWMLAFVILFVGSALLG